MKRCPQCNSVFADNQVYCTTDGTPLEQENLALPSEFEEETVVRRDPIKIDVTDADQMKTRVDFSPPPTEAAATPVVVVKQRNAGKYLLFLVVGLLLGGGLVLATLFFARNYDRANNPNQAANKTETTVNREPKTPTPTPTPAPTPNAEHLARTETADEDFNGRVIVENANIRSSPSKNAPAVTLLPNGDRLNIERRASDESPWYYVTCEHGTSGWMHGDTIEFTQEGF